MKKIYILLPVHNRKEITRGFVECLKAQTFSDYHLILIDDGSTDGTTQMVRENITSVTILEGFGDWWWAGSLQQGINWLKKQKIDNNALVLFINDDVSFFPDYLARAVTILNNNRGSLVLSRFLMQESNEIVETGVCADLQHLTFKIADKADQINCLSTRGLFAYWEDILNIGGFYPILLPHYLSDYEYSIRAHRKGFKCVSSEDLLIIPNLETTGYHHIKKKNFNSFLNDYFSKKSASNPIYWSSFVLLTSKSKYMVQNVSRVWIRAGKSIIRAFVMSMNLCSHR